MPKVRELGPNDFKVLQGMIDSMYEYQHRLQRSGGQDVETFYKNRPEGEKNALVVVLDIFTFLSNHEITDHEKHYTDQKALIARDANRKGQESKFGEYTLHVLNCLEEMRKQRLIKGYHYISQANSTPIERTLDEAGIDWLIEDWEGWKIVQPGTRPGNARDKLKDLVIFYEAYLTGEGGEGSKNLFGVFPLLDRYKNKLSVNATTEAIENTLQATRSLNPPGRSWGRD